MDLNEFREECRDYLDEIDKKDELVFVPLRDILDLSDLPEQSTKSLRAEYRIIQRLKRIEDDKEDYTFENEEIKKDDLLTLEEKEKEMIGEYIARLRPDTTWMEIAKILGISKKTLWKKRQKYGFD